MYNIVEIILHWYGGSQHNEELDFVELSKNNITWSKDYYPITK